LILADALVYADTFKPHTIIDVATLTGAIGVALGSHYSGAFTTSDELWEEVSKAGTETFVCVTIAKICNFVKGKILAYATW
jgi:aminopeptidase